MKYITIPKAQLNNYKLAYRLLNENIKTFPLSDKQQKGELEESIKIQVPQLSLNQQLQIVKFLRNKNEVQ